jgi:hypothetical protein
MGLTLAQCFLAGYRFAAVRLENRPGGFGPIMGHFVAVALCYGFRPVCYNDGAS